MADKLRNVDIDVSRPSWTVRQAIQLVGSYPIVLVPLDEAHNGITTGRACGDDEELNKALSWARGLSTIARIIPVQAVPKQTTV
jgi:hypothetical protein